ncbi:hypothetical protein BDW22DRAFT_1358009 [Trametopsis cervina]|nr:hypothetical protein BDW22DRAFT_1358009 [Trametopsis cervina]
MSKIHDLGHGMHPLRTSSPRGPQLDELQPTSCRCSSHVHDEVISLHIDIHHSFTVFRLYAHFTRIAAIQRGTWLSNSLAFRSI